VLNYLEACTLSPIHLVQQLKADLSCSPLQHLRGQSCEEEVAIPAISAKTGQATNGTNATLDDSNLRCANGSHCCDIWYSYQLLYCNAECIDDCPHQSPHKQPVLCCSHSCPTLTCDNSSFTPLCLEQHRIHTAQVTEM
jgi:hypothetical protein